jgi:hypothetical protein
MSLPHKTFKRCHYINRSAALDSVRPPRRSGLGGFLEDNAPSGELITSHCQCRTLFKDSNGLIVLYWGVILTPAMLLVLHGLKVLPVGKYPSL